jgi:hypothetical protein
MNARMRMLLSGTLAGFVLPACMSTTPQLDSTFGQAVNQAKMQQILNPGPASTANPVGLGGTPARESIERYHDTFRAPPPTFEIIFGTGGGASSGGGR